MGAQALEVDIEIDHVGAVNGAAHGAAIPQAFLEQIQSPVAEAGGQPLRRPHVAKDHLEAVGSASRIEPFFEPAFEPAVGDVHRRTLSLGPELDQLLGALLGDGIGARRRRSGRGLLRNHPSSRHEHYDGESECGDE